MAKNKVKPRHENLSDYVDDLQGAGRYCFTTADAAAALGAEARSHHFQI